MKAYQVNGWTQYKTDTATPIDRVVLAGSAEEAEKQILETLKSPNRVNLITKVIEIGAAR